MVYRMIFQLKLNKNQRQSVEKIVDRLKVDGPLFEVMECDVLEREDMIDRDKQALLECVAEMIAKGQRL